MRAFLFSSFVLAAAGAIAQPAAKPAAEAVIVTVDGGVKIACSVLGSGPRNVMFVHGWMNSRVGYQEVLDGLDPTGLRIVSCDLRGTGASDKPAAGYTIEQFAKDTLAVAKHLKISKMVLVGFSMGGPICEWIAATSPGSVSGLVLINPSPASGVPLPPDVVTMFRGSTGKRDVQKSIYEAGGSKNIPPTTLAALLDDAGKTPAQAIEGGFDAFTKADFIAKLKSIKAPTVVIGSDDGFYNNEVLKATVVDRIAGSRLVYLPGAGHWTIAEKPREVAAVIGAFLAGLR